MKTKKVVVQLHAHSLVRYTGELVVEAPEDMCEDCIRHIIWSNANELPDPEWVQDEEDGLYTVYTDENDESPDILPLLSADAVPSVRLKKGKGGIIRVLVRRERDEE
jgi:hypothetical protein